MNVDELVRLTKSHERSVIERVQAGNLLAEIGDPRIGVGLGVDGRPDIAWSDWIPAGSFAMGSSTNDKLALGNEHPEHIVGHGMYRISAYPVTNRQFRAFAEASDEWESDALRSESGLAFRSALLAWRQGNAPDNYPCVNVSWYAAVAFADWMSTHCTQQEGSRVRLPTEPEWERASRGTDGRLYPWGDTFDSRRCNSVATGIGDLTSVGIFPGGQSPVGAFDMSGGTWEWCLSLSGPYPYTVAREAVELQGKRVIRGGAYNQDHIGVRCAVRREDAPEYSAGRVSFRLVQPMTP